LWANPVLMVHAEAHWPIQAGLSLLGTGEAVSKGVRDACCRMSEGGLRSTGKAKLARATHRACGERRSPFAEVLHGPSKSPWIPLCQRGDWQRGAAEAPAGGLGMPHVSFRESGNPGSMNSLAAIGVLRRVAVTYPLGRGQVVDLTLTEQVQQNAAGGLGVSPVSDSLESPFPKGAQGGLGARGLTGLSQGFFSCQPVAIEQMRKEETLEGPRAKGYGGRFCPLRALERRGSLLQPVGSQNLGGILQMLLEPLLGV